MQILSIGGHSNSGSVVSALSQLGINARWVLPGGSIDACSPLLLPGVGTFQGAMEYLSSTGLREEVVRHGGREAALVGICLGFQILFSEGEESADSVTKGLDIFPGRVEPIGIRGRPNLNVGWKEVFGNMKSDGQENVSRYFCHSYFVQPSHLSAEVSYFKETPITACFRLGNAVGYQYHPELSGLRGVERLATDLGFRST